MNPSPVMSVGAVYIHRTKSALTISDVTKINK